MFTKHMFHVMLADGWLVGYMLRHPLWTVWQACHRDVCLASNVFQERMFNVKVIPRA